MTEPPASTRRELHLIEQEPMKFPGVLVSFILGHTVEGEGDIHKNREEGHKSVPIFTECFFFA